MAAMKPLAWLCTVWLWLGVMPLAWAQVQAELDRGQLTLGEVATLTLRVDAADASPDYAPLERDFLIYSPTMRRYSQMQNGRFTSRVEYVLGIQPRRAGVLQVPALQVGNQSTRPLLLTVSDTPAGTAGQDGSAPGLSFIRTRIDTARPWVHQSVGVVVALYYATQLSGGQLDQDAPAHAGLQRVGEDRVDQAMVDGRHYNVVERRYLLLPERSGPLQLPPARFRGRAAGAGRGQLLVAEQDPALDIVVQARPAAAPEPWLPVHDLLLGWQVVPGQLVAGQGTELVLEAQVDGASRAQLDTLPLPPDGPGYRLYPQATDVEERFDGDRPQLLLRRRVVVVAERPGPLQLPAVQLAWWQVEQGQLRHTVQPAINLQVVAASATARGAAAPAIPATPAVSPAAASGPANGEQATWPAGAGRYLYPGLALVAILLGGLLLWRYRGRETLPVALQGSVPASLQLQARLAQGSWQEIVDALVAATGANDWQGVLDALVDPAQQEALRDAEKAWWAAGDGDRVAARAALRAAFAGGVACRRPSQPPAQGPLPPLYPP